MTMGALEDETSDPPGTCELGSSCAYQSVPCDCYSYMQCLDGVLTTYSCPPKFPYYNPGTGQCDSQPNGCTANALQCCPCGYKTITTCGTTYIYQDHQDPYYGPAQCIQNTKTCPNGGRWDPKISKQGQCNTQDECEKNNPE